MSDSISLVNVLVHDLSMQNEVNNSHCKYCKFGNFREDFIFAKFHENKTLVKWQNHFVVY